MGASCTVQGWKPIREEDIITKVRYDKPLGDISGVVRVYYKSHLYDDEREYDCVKTFIWASKAEDYVKFVVPIINTPSAFIKGNRYYAEWAGPKKPANAKKNAVIAEKKSENAKKDDVQLTFF